jgi:transcriptional regulator with XRE-family HTH domain
MGKKAYASIREYLQKTHQTARELAEKVGVSEAYVLMLKAGKRRPSPELAKKLEAVTGIPFRKLLLPSEKNSIS